MNIKAIITTLAIVTGVSASSAMADVRISGNASYEVSGGVTIRDHRSPRYTQPAPVYTQPRVTTVRDHRAWWNPEIRQPRPIYQNGWMTLATGLHDGQDLMLNGRYSNLDTIMIRGLDSNVTIGAVVIEYVGGAKQVVRPSQRLSRNESLSLQLDRNAPVRKISVHVSGGNQGSYAVFAN